MSDKNIRGGFQRGSQRKSIKDDVTSLRKKKRDAAMDSFPAAIEAPTTTPGIEIHFPPKITEEYIAEYYAKFDTGDLNDALTALTAIRMLVSAKQSRNFNIYRSLIAHNMMPKIFAFCNPAQEEHCKEACWICTNIASREHEIAVALIDAGVIPVMASVLKNTESTSIAEQAIWTLGNVAGEGAEYRITTLDTGVMADIARFLGKDMPPKRVRNFTWSTSNIARTPLDPAHITLLCDLIPAMTAVFVRNQVDPAAEFSKESKISLEILADVIFFMSFIGDGNESDIRCILNANLTPAIIQYASVPFAKMSTAIIRYVGNVISMDNSATIADYLIQCGIFPAFDRMLTSPTASVRMEVMWAMANFAAGTPKQMQCFLDSGFITKTLELVHRDTAEVVTECAFVLYNFAGSCTPDQLATLLDCDTIITLVGTLKRTTSRKAKSTLLECLTKILRREPKAARQVEDAGGFDVLNSLAFSHYQTLAAAAQQIIDDFFDYEESDGFESDGDLIF
ncbi:Armadillo/beta-catenin-like repeat [Carpediemonas membranifera]|uniref:Importin subunit alpha n=1 Tax=Carpediemonas membranifera TaxID=201153 RepID=A0A8J6E1T1_9EUKA|nr:Armadillo/beta-catenin-like repeat [Carpediemonas membranifera]|eukprot:KAG9393848.1 Armadillo/beta-catenin-like repeat [Carpediemonas membranifera]